MHIGSGLNTVSSMYRQQKGNNMKAPASAEKTFYTAETPKVYQIFTTDNMLWTEFQGEGTGSAAHVYNECGEEVLTYTEGVGWQEKETKAESQVHSALKSTYYEAFCDARKALNSEQRTGGMNENIMSQGNFDMKA